MALWRNWPATKLCCYIITIVTTNNNTSNFVDEANRIMSCYYHHDDGLQDIAVCAFHEFDSIQYKNWLLSKKRMYDQSCGICTKLVQSTKSHWRPRSQSCCWWEDVSLCCLWMVCTKSWNSKRPDQKDNGQDKVHEVQQDDVWSMLLLL